MKHQLREEFTKYWASELESVAATQSTASNSESKLNPKIKQVIQENEQAFTIGFYVLEGKNYYLKESDELIQLKVFPLFRDNENLLTFTSKEGLYDKSTARIDNFFSINEKEDDYSDFNDDAVMNHINRTPIIQIKSFNTKRQSSNHNDINSFADNIKQRQAQFRKFKQLSLANYERNFALSYKHLESLILPKTSLCKSVSLLKH